MMGNSSVSRLTDWYPALEDDEHEEEEEDELEEAPSSGDLGVSGSLVLSGFLLWSSKLKMLGRDRMWVGVRMIVRWPN